MGYSTTPFTLHYYKSFFIFRLYFFIRNSLICYTFSIMQNEYDTLINKRALDLQCIALNRLIVQNTLLHYHTKQQLLPYYHPIPSSKARLPLLNEDCHCNQLIQAANHYNLKCPLVLQSLLLERLH